MAVRGIAPKRVGAKGSGSLGPSLGRRPGKGRGESVQESGVQKPGLRSD